MVDYYGLPKTGSRAWPGREAAANLSFPQKAVTLETAHSADVCGKLGARFDPERFIPFVMMQEFEGLLFSHCHSFAKGIGRPNLAADFQAIRDQFASREEIDDSPDTAPSKRVENLVEGYQKPLLGSLAAIEIGLPRIRSECPHFAE